MKLNGCHSRNDGPPVMQHILNACHIRPTLSGERKENNKKKREKINKLNKNERTKNKNNKKKKKKDKE